MRAKTDYSEAFGRKVIKAFERNYSRGTYILAGLLDIDVDDFRIVLEHYVRKDQIRWRVVKDIIKRIEKSPNICEISDLYDDVVFVLNTSEAKYPIFAEATQELHTIFKKKLDRVSGNLKN